MADFAGAFVDMPVGLDAPDVADGTFIEPDEIFYGEAGPQPIGLFHQEIYDSGLAQFVYYTLTFVTATPLVTDTIPNHSGSLVAATHAVY